MIVKLKLEQQCSMWKIFGLLQQIFIEQIPYTKNGAGYHEGPENQSKRGSRTYGTHDLDGNWHIRNFKQKVDYSKY